MLDEGRARERERDEEERGKKESSMLGEGRLSFLADNIPQMSDGESRVKEHSASCLSGEMQMLKKVTERKWKHCIGWQHPR